MDVLWWQTSQDSIICGGAVPCAMIPTVVPSTMWPIMRRFVCEKSSAIADVVGSEIGHLAEEINPWLRGKGMRIDICWTQNPDDKGSGVPEGELLASEGAINFCLALETTTCLHVVSKK